MDFATLYAEDVETWAELQVDALRRLAATPGSWANIIDWENVLEEIESLGSEQRRAVESLLENALAHALKVVGDPNSLSTERWKKEIVNFLRQARKKIKPAMRSRIDIEEIWQDACEQASDTLEAFDRTLPDVPQRCPFSFDDLLDADFDPLRHLPLLTVKRTSRQ